MLNSKLGWANAERVLLSKHEQTFLKEDIQIAKYTGKDTQHRSSSGLRAWLDEICNNLPMQNCVKPTCTTWPKIYCKIAQIFNQII